jgi:hypothetical protein
MDSTVDAPGLEADRVGEDPASALSQGRDENASTKVINKRYHWLVPPWRRRRTDSAAAQLLVKQLDPSQHALGAAAELVDLLSQ